MGGMRRRERDRDERKVFKERKKYKKRERKHKQKVNQSGTEPIDRKKEKLNCAEGERKVETKERKVRFIDQPESEGEKQKGGDECSQGNRSAKERGMDE